MTIARAFTLGAAAAAGAIAAAIAGAVVLVVLVDQLARPRPQLLDVKFSYGGGRRPAVDDDARDRYGAF